MAVRSTGRWRSWIWTELRPQRVMWGRPSPARWAKMRSPQTAQPGRGWEGGGVAGFDGAGGGLGEDAGEAGGTVRAVGEDVHGGRVGADGGGVDPGDGLAEGVVVDEIAGLEVVGGVEDELDGAEAGGGEE